MIKVSRLNGESLLVNPDLIRTIEVHPQTVLIFVDGHTMVIKDTPEEVQEMVANFKNKCWSHNRFLEK